MLVAFALVQALQTAPMDGASTPSRYDACVAAIQQDAASAYETAQAWAHEEKSIEAKSCAALALIELNRPREAAERYDSLSLVGTETQRAEASARAGHAWLLARNAARARMGFDRALKLAGPDADLHLDRAQAFIMANDWKAAEEDLNRTLDLRADDGLALRLRAEARMRAGAFELAVKDAEDAVRALPKDVDALLTFGRAFEALRTGKAPD
jgi:tetratricopeptide (TPR) repeat protein